MAHGKRDFDRLIQETKRNPALTGRQRQAQMQHLLREKRLSDQSHAADTPAPAREQGFATTTPREDRAAAAAAPAPKPRSTQHGYTRADLAAMRKAGVGPED